MPLDFGAPLRPPQAPRLSDMVFDRLAEAIVHGQILPGENLRDQGLAERLGVSRMPVREALLRLERAGLVETSASRYTRVIEITPERTLEIVEHAGYLYGAATRMATRRMDDAQRTEALALLDAIIAAGTDRNAYFQAGRAYNRHILASCGNRSFLLVSDLVYTVDYVTRNVSFDGIMHVVRPMLDRLRRAIAEGDADAAERVVRELHGIDGDLPEVAQRAMS
ncbi:hypothetical protein ASD19_12370 [Microbacterium sp. Root53]|nr:hypothetical protein ASD19_12370 [Microbacterium sp. Root53]